MLLKVQHRTEYRYSKPVSNSSNQLRLTPINTVYQRCRSSLISVLPATKLAHYEDLNGHRVHYFEIPRAHQRLSISSQATVETTPPVDLQQLPYGIHRQQLAQCKGLEACHPHLQNSTFVECSPRAWRQALDIQGNCTDVFQTCYALMQYIFANYRYQPGATTVATHANEVLASQTGVCQDFAHAMLAMCRSIEIPARYVSGYCFDTTGEEGLRGSTASHAWVDVYLPNYGWIGLDPTNNQLVDERYIVLAKGRDYRDVAPVMGTFSGAGASSTLSVNVQIDKISH